MNRNIWNLYEQSERGRNVIAAFTVTEQILDDGAAIEQKIKEILPFCRDFLGAESDDVLVNGFFLVEGSMLVDNLVPGKNESALSYFERVIDHIVIGWTDVNENPSIARTSILVQRVSGGDGPLHQCF